MPPDDAPTSTAIALPESLDRSLDRPFGGLLGNSVIVRVVNELVSDPYVSYTTTEVAEFTQSSVPSVRDALAVLVSEKFLTQDASHPKRPMYSVNPDSKRLIALTLLSYAALDDTLGTNHFDNAVLEYIVGEYRPRRAFTLMICPIQTQSGPGAIPTAALVIQSGRPSTGPAGKEWIAVFATNMVPQSLPAEMTVPLDRAPPGS
jgi:hypothetical protein